MSPLKTSKPNIDAFIKGAKAETIKEPVAEPPAQATAPAPAAEEELLKKDKTFLLRMPITLWSAAKDKAAKQKIPLHDYILLSVKEKTTREE